jgi:hypothetical protein
MVRKAQTPAQPVKQEPVDVAPNMDGQHAGAPLVEEIEQLPVVETPPEPELEPIVPVEVESLTAYAARMEAAAQPLAVCQITHPDAKDGGLHVGTYAGIRLVRGDTPAALLSDGSTI